MASKGTPTKIYKKTTLSTPNISRCRLCNTVQDSKHCKNLFSTANEAILQRAELIYGENIPQVHGFPHLICRPCERRLNNAISFKNVITETQKLLRKDARLKRCIEFSPSVIGQPPKVLVRDASRRRSIDFGVGMTDETQQNLPTASTVSFHYYVFLLLEIGHIYDLVKSVLSISCKHH